MIAVFVLGSLSVSGGEMQTKPLTPAEAIKAVQPSIVRVDVLVLDATSLPEELQIDDGLRWKKLTIGSGFFVTDKGHVITALHVVNQANKLLEKTQAKLKSLTSEL